MTTFALSAATPPPFPATLLVPAEFPVIMQFTKLASAAVMYTPPPMRAVDGGGRAVPLPPVTVNPSSVAGPTGPGGNANRTVLVLRPVALIVVTVGPSVLFTVIALPLKLI